MKPKAPFFLPFFTFLVITLCLYASTIGSGFTMDFIGWQMRYDAGKFSDILTCFGYPGLHQLLHFVFFSFYKLFRTDGLPWYLLFCTLHAFNAALLFAVFKRIFERFEIGKARWVAFFGALFFLVLPYQAEVVVWKTCVHYLLSAGLMLGSLWFALDFLENRNNRPLLAAHVSFGLALFSLEMAFMTPFWMLALVLVWRYSRPEGRSIYADFLGLVLPQFLILAAYFLLTKLVLGQWIGHYGAETHLKFSFLTIASTAWKYFFKYAFFVRLFDFQYKSAFFGWLEKPEVTLALTTIAGILFLSAIFYFKKLGNRTRLAGLLLILFFLSIAPVSNLYFYFLQFNENDRYGYHASMFLMMLAALLFFKIQPRFTPLLIVAWLIISTYFTIKINSYWKANREVFYGLLHDFRWYDKDEIWILNIPDNYLGTFMFRIVNTDSGFPNNLKHSIQKPFSGKITDIAQYNMVNITDGVAVEQTDSATLRVKFNQWGNWWWRNGIGASNYENDRYRFETIDNGYLLHIKQLPNNAAIIYQTGKKWEIFPFKF